MAIPALGLFLAADVPNLNDYMPNKFQFYELCFFLVWAVWAVLNFWIWSKTKARGNLFMLIGSGALAALWLISLFSWDHPIWLHFCATVVLTIGFFFTVKPLVEAQIAALKSKMQNLTAKKEGGGSSTPPTPPPAK